MGLVSEEVDTITVDSFTTLVDVAGPTTTVLADYVSNPTVVAARWRSRAIAYRMVATFTDSYEPYLQTTREALESALAGEDIALSPAELAELTQVFESLPVIKGVSEAIIQLADRGYAVYILSNGERKLLEDIAERAEIASKITGILSADDVQTYKPAAGIYEYAAAKTDTPLSRITHVAAPWYDIYGAIAVGMQSIWVNRNSRPWEPFDGTPDLVVEALTDVPPAL